MRITCQNFNFQLEKTAREIAFHHFGSFLAGPACIDQGSFLVVFHVAGSKKICMQFSSPEMSPPNKDCEQW